MAENREEEAGSREEEAGSREEEVGSREEEAENREEDAGSREEGLLVSGRKQGGETCNGSFMLSFYTVEQLLEVFTVVTHPGSVCNNGWWMKPLSVSFAWIMDCLHLYILEHIAGYTVNN